MVLYALSWFLLGVSCSKDASNFSDQQMCTDTHVETSNPMQAYVNDDLHSSKVVLPLDGEGK